MASSQISKEDEAILRLLQGAPFPLTAHDIGVCTGIAIGSVEACLPRLEHGRYLVADRPNAARPSTYAIGYSGTAYLNAQEWERWENGRRNPSRQADGAEADR